MTSHSIISCRGRHRRLARSTTGTLKILRNLLKSLQVPHVFPNRPTSSNPLKSFFHSTSSRLQFLPTLSHPQNPFCPSNPYNALQSHHFLSPEDWPQALGPEHHWNGSLSTYDSVGHAPRSPDPHSNSLHLTESPFFLQTFSHPQKYLDSKLQMLVVRCKSIMEIHSKNTPPLFFPPQISILFAFIDRNLIFFSVFDNKLRTQIMTAAFLQIASHFAILPMVHSDECFEQ